MLTKRQLLVLKEIIRLFTESGQPVGSKTLMQELPVHVSSATIRNDMAALEDAGLITKTHSSSGRVPSTQGYRYYLDHLVEPVRVSRHDLATIKQELGQRYSKMDEIVAQSAQILSNLTSYTAISLGPEVNNIKLTGFRLVPLGNHQVMAILVTNNGNVENQVFTVPPSISSDELEKAIRIVNDQLVGLPLVQVAQRLRTDVPSMLMQYLTSPDGFLDIFGNVLKSAASERFYVGGRLNLMDYLGDSDIHELKKIMSLIDADHGDLTELLGGPIRQTPVQVQLGPELKPIDLANLSLITASYAVSYTHLTLPTNSLV